MSVQVPPVFVPSSKFTDPTAKRPAHSFLFTKNSQRKDFVRMSRSSTAAPPSGSKSSSLAFCESVSARSSRLQDPLPQPYNKISDIGVFEDTERLDNRVLKEKSNLRKTGSLGHRRKPSRASLRSSGVRFAEETPQDNIWDDSDGINNNDGEKPKIPHKQSVLVLPKVPIGGVKLNSVKDRIAKQDAKLTTNNFWAEQSQPLKQQFLHNLNLKSVYIREKPGEQQTPALQSDKVKPEERTAEKSGLKLKKLTKVSIVAQGESQNADFLTSNDSRDDLVVALLNAKNTKLSSSNLSSKTEEKEASCAYNKMAATNGRWRTVTKLTKREENHVHVVEEEEEEEIFFRSSATRQPEVDELGPEPEAAGNVRVFHEQFMDDDEEVDEDFGNGLMSLGVSKDYSSSLSSSQITVNGELCAQNLAKDSANLTSKLRSLLRDSGLDTTWDKNQTVENECVDTVHEMSDHEEESEVLLCPKSDIAAIKDEQTSVKQLPEVTVNGDHRNGLWFAEEKLKTRSNIDWDKLEKLHCPEDIPEVDWLQKVRLRNVLEDSSCENRIGIPVGLGLPTTKQNGAEDDRKWMDPLLRLQQSGAVDWDSLDKKSLNTFGKVICDYPGDKDMTSAGPPPSATPFKVDLKHVRQIEVRRSDKAMETKSEKDEEAASIRVHLRHVETPAKSQQQEITVQGKSGSRSPDQVVLIKNTYNAHEWRQLEHEIETKRRPKVETPSPEWVREAEEKRRSFHEWGSAFDSKPVRPCLDITNDGHKDDTHTTNQNQWMSIQQTRSKKQQQQEDWQETEVKNSLWQKDDGHSIRVHVPDSSSSDMDNREDQSLKFDVEGYVKGLVRMRKSTPSKSRPQSSPDFAAHIPTTPEWLPIAERKLRNSFDWDSLERSKKSSASKPDVSKMDFEDDEVASESDSSAFSWYGGQRATKALDSPNPAKDPDWVQVSSKKKDIDWDQLEGRLTMTDDRETEAPWVSLVNLKSPQLTTTERLSDGFRLQDVDLRPVDVQVTNGSRVNSPCNPEWVEIAESKKKSDIDWQALDSECLATTSSDNLWTKAVCLRHVEDEERVENKTTWSKSDDSSSCSGYTDDPLGSPPIKEGQVDRRISKFDPDVAAQDVVRRNKNLQSRTRSTSESLSEDTSPDWLKLVQYKQTVSVDWNQLENDLEKKVESPSLPEVVLRKVDRKPNADFDIDCHVTWLEIADRKRNSGVDWDKLDAEKPMTQSTEALWVQGLNLKPARTKSAEIEEQDGSPYESVSLRHVDPPMEDSTRDFSSGLLWEERPTTPNVDRWQARYKEMFIDLSCESSPPEDDVPRRDVHKIELSDHGELRHGITWSRLMEDKELENGDCIDEPTPRVTSLSEYRLTRQVGNRPDSGEFRPNPPPSWTENLKKLSPPTTLNIKQDKTEDQSWLSQTRLRSVSSKTSLNEEDASPTTPDWMSKVEKRRSAPIDWDAIKADNKELEANKEAQWLKDLSLREVKRNPVSERLTRENKVSTEFKSLIKSPDIDAKKILEDLPKRRRGTVRPKEPEVLTGREALMAEIKGGKVKLRTTSTTSLDNDAVPVAEKQTTREVEICPSAPLPPPAPTMPTSTSALTKKPQSFANVLDEIKNCGRDGLLASLRRAKTGTKSWVEDVKKITDMEQEENGDLEIVAKQPEEKASFQVTTSDKGGDFAVVIDDKDDTDFLTKKPDVSVYTKSLSEKYFRKELESPRKVAPKSDSSSPPRVLSTLIKSQSLKSQHTSDAAPSSKSRFSSDPGDRKLLGKVSNVRKETLTTGDNIEGALNRSSVTKSRFQTAGSSSTSTSPALDSTSPTSIQHLEKKDSLASVKLLQEIRTRNSSNPDLATSTCKSSTAFSSYRKEPLSGIGIIIPDLASSSSPIAASKLNDTGTTLSLTSLHLLSSRISESPTRLSVSDTDLTDATGEVGRRSSSRKVVTFDVEEPTAIDDSCAVEDAEVAKITRRDVTDPKSWLTPTISTSLRSKGVASSSDPKSSATRLSLSSKSSTSASGSTSRSKAAIANRSRTADRAASPKKQSTTSSSPSPTKFASTTCSAASATGSTPSTGRSTTFSKTRTERPSSPRKDSGRKKWEIPKPGSPVPVMCMAQENGSNSEASSSRRSSQYSQVVEEVAEGPKVKTETTEVTSLPEATRSVTTHTTSGVRYVTAKGKDESNGQDTLIGARGDSTKTISQLETICGPDDAVVATREVHGTSGQTVSYQRLTSGAQSVRKTSTTVTTVKTRRKLSPAP